MKSIIEFSLASFFGIIMPVLFYIKIVSALAGIDFVLAIYCTWFFQEQFSWRKASIIVLKLTVFMGLLTTLHYEHLALGLPSTELFGVKITLATGVAACFMFAEMKSIGEKWTKLFGYNPFVLVFSVFKLFKTVEKADQQEEKNA